MLNECFLKFKNIHQGKSAVLLGNGHSFNKFDTSKKIITIGCNQHIRCTDLNLDYYFIGDAEDKRKGYNRDPESYHKYFKTHKETNFVRINQPGPPCTRRCASVPQGIENCLYYHVNKCIKKWQDLSADPTKNMCISASISFDMLQFILYTGIKRLYLVGQDCTLDKGSFYSKRTRCADPKTSLDMAGKRWMEAKMFIEHSYPEVETYIINPVRMKHFKECKLDDMVENL